ncbi:MAG: SRPBCC domain-containing protein [Bdellovibrionaceae bacterium]|nr:SRPBCC domain-containing protein [Pseudobdellovibrionaceae bacterium]
MHAKNKSNKLKLTRVYNAPVETVWEAWVDPKKAAKWWGPRGFKITTHSKDLKVGGHWNYTMHGPDGVDYPNITTYFEVDKYRRLVYDHGANQNQPALFRVTVVFTDLGGKTKMDMTMALATEDAAEQTRKFIKQANGNSTWDRLAEYLEKENSSKEIFVINRTFNTPIETMFKMWTDPNHFSKWLAPTGFDMKFIRSDIKANSSTFYCMENSDGLKMYGRAHYKEVKSPHRLVYTQEFCDEKNEKTTRHPMAPTWPAMMLTTIDLTAESPMETRVTITWEVVGNVTREEMETFIEGRTGMTMGWTGSLDKLESYLEKVG